MVHERLESGAIMHDLTLREAGSEDSAVIARLWSCTFDDKFSWVFCENSLPFLEAWLAADPGVYTGTTLAFFRGAPAAYVQTSCPQWSTWRRAWPLLRLLIGNYGFLGGLKRLAQCAVSERDRITPRGELHVNMIGVAPAFRGQGIAWALLAHCETQARERGKHALSLGVVERNTSAKGLYERFGFTTLRHVRSGLVHWACGHGGYYAMRKDLPQAGQDNRV